MGSGKICDCCMEFTSLLQSYDGKRVPLNKLGDVNITREEIETIALYMQSWTQRQCSCCFRDSKNFERFNWALQVLILVVVEILKNFPNRATGCEAEVKPKNLPCDENVDNETNNETKQPSKAIPLWDVEDKEKLIHFVSKVFLNNFPTYTAYKQHLQMKTEEITQQEIHGLGQFCEISEPEANPYLFRNVALFCKVGGMAALTNSTTNQTPEKLPIHQANIIVALATNLKTWLNFHALINFYVSFRSNVLSYMCKLVDMELKTSSDRNMAEYIWSAVKDPVDAHISFDKDGLDLAFKYFLSSTLTMRLAGVAQITNHINLFNELLNSDHILDTDNLDQCLSVWLLERQLIQHIFGPNLHVEVVKQCHSILTFLATEGKITNDHLDIIWQAAQLKHCSKQVYDVLSSLISNMEPGPVQYLNVLMSKLEPKDHSEQSLFLSSSLTKFIWTNAVVAKHSPIALSTPNPKGRNISGRSRLVELSSSENSVSVEASQSEDDVQMTMQMSRAIPVQKVLEDIHEVVGLKPICQMFKSGHLCKVVSPETSDDDSISRGESGKSDDQENVHASSSGYIETHSDSDADAERSGNEDTPKKPKRRVLRRKKTQNVPGKENLGDNSVEIRDISTREPHKDSRNTQRVTARKISRGVSELLEPNTVINELTHLVQMTDPSIKSVIREFVPDLLDGSDGSYSSRISTKSEKNMADFDGEESCCEDDLMQNLTQNQLVEMASRNQIRIGGPGPVFGARPLRNFNRRGRRRMTTTPGFNFSIDTVCEPGQTLLWDLIQDDKITLLSEGLAVEAQKALTALLCINMDKIIRFKFIEGCLENIAKNRSIVVSLRLLPKLLTSFQQSRVTNEVHQVTLWAEREHNLLDKFFANLKCFKESRSSSPFSYQINVQVRLEFLSVIFSMMGSPEEFRLRINHVDELWECLATDSGSSDDLFVWLTGQVRIREQHALSAESLRHIFIKKLPSQQPETVTMHALTLFQQLCNMARTSGEQDVEAAASSMDYLWKIALCAHNTDVSMTAIQYLNGYYISRQLEKEDEFIERCMSHLGEATEELTHSTPADEAPLLRIQRALLLLKTHLETFRKRYAYHLRRWHLEGNGVGSHAELVGGKGGIPIKVVIQPAGYHEKVTLELQSTDYVADLRAEVAKWWESIQGNMASEKHSATPVLGSLLTDGVIRMITQGIELSAEYDEKCISEVPMKDMQLVYVSMGAARTQKKKDSMEYSSSLPPPPRDKLPVTLLLQMKYFEQLFSLMQSLSAIKMSDRTGSALPHTKAQVLSRRVWDILMLLPTNPAIHEGFTKLMASEDSGFRNLLDPASPQKLMYSLYIVEALVKISPTKTKETHSGSSSNETELNGWRQHFVERGGLRHLFDVFVSGVLESVESDDWSEWKQDCLASLLKILCFLGIMSEDTECLSEQLYDVNEMPRKRAKRRKISNEKSSIPRLNETMLSMMEVGLVMTRLTNILQACSLPRDPNYYKTGFWGRAQVVHYAMALLVCWAFSCTEVRPALYTQACFPQWLKKLVLEDPEPAVRREVCTGLYRLCLGVSTDGRTGVSFAPELISNLLKFLAVSLSIKPNQRVDVQVHSYDEGKEPYGPACRDYFWLLGRLLDSLAEDFVKESIEDPDNCVIDLDGLAGTLSKSVLTRDYLETRHITLNDDGLVGLLTTTTVVMKHNPPFKTSKEGQQFLSQVFECLFALPSPQMRYLPKCKSLASRASAYDLLTEMARNSVQNYYLLQNLLMNQHQPSFHSPYPWDYWPHEDGRSSCGYVGLTNLGATCYMASCMQHLYMMPQARSSILGAKFSTESKHEHTLIEMQRMFAYLMESERKAYNPRSFCKVYQMDHQPLNTGEQKDMAEFFIDLVSKLEEMTPELKKLVKNLFCGVTSNNVVSLDCPHVSRTLEEFYTVRCQVADMRNLYESLDEVTVKDTLEGDNMYTCSQCGKKVRAEKRACFKKLPRILCFNTMRYTFNMITMMKEKVNTHFSFPLHLDMTGYVEKTLMPQQYQDERNKKQSAKKEGNDENVRNEMDLEEDECHEYDLIGVTVHTGTADGGHYYSFIRDRVSPNKDKWYLFNDAEVKSFDPNQIAAECFGGEMNTKTYDSVTDKFMDFSFEKTNSAYMLFYERCTPISSPMAVGEGSLVPSLPGGSSHKQLQAQCAPAQTMELNKELEDWIWLDNMHFLRDKNIFEHTYFNFMWQACGYIPQSLMGQEDVTLLAAKLSVTFFLETFIHAKEKPTMVQWVELLTKQLASSQTAAAWLLDHMAETDWWPVQILLKCPNQMVRQMFQRLCIHVIQQLRSRHTLLYLKLPEGQLSDHPNDVNLQEFGSVSCITRFIKQLLSLLERGAKSHLKHLTEYFTFLHDFSKMGDDECLFLINVQAISAMVNFYLGNKKDDQMEHGSDPEEEEEEIVSIPVEKSKVASLEKMIALVAILVEKSRDETNGLRLSTNDWNSLTGGGGKSFPFILQQIRDGINLQSTRNLIFSLCRWNDKLAEDIVIGIFQSIQKHPDICHPFFKVLNLLAELLAGPPGMPSFTELILSRILDVADICPYPTLEWLAAQVPRNKLVHSWCLSSMNTWVEHFLIGHAHQRVRNAAASLLVSLVPNPHFRQSYRSTKMYGAHCREVVTLSTEAIHALHEIYSRLLNLLKPAKHYTDAATHGTSKLTAYFAVLTYFTISKNEKFMFGPYFMDLWQLFHPKLSEPSIPCHHNKQALLTFWHHVSLDCPENIQRIVHNPVVTKHIGFNYILADHDDQEVVMFNRTMLPSYYAILRMCCQNSRIFALQLSRHQNITWAFKNISPFPTQYPVAVEELFKMMQIFVQKPSDASEQEVNEIAIFRRNTLILYLQSLDGRSNWSTLVSSFRILIDALEDKIYTVCNNGLGLLFEAFHTLHTMHHEATACHITGEIIELLALLVELLRTFRPKEFAHGMTVYTLGELQISRLVSASKEWPEVLRKLTTLLNTYNGPDLRASVIEALVELLYIMPLDTLRTLVPLMVHCHSAYQDAQSVGLGSAIGPYFPKRSPHGGATIKPAVRPPRPMLQMAYPHVIHETSKLFKGVDEEYERQLKEFYHQYHAFVDLMCRVAFMKDFVTQELITLSAMLGVEAAPLHFIHFPKLWLEVFNTANLDRKYITMLVNTTYFAEYVELVMIEERTSLTNVVIYNFLCTYLPRVYDLVAATPQLIKLALNISMDLKNLIVKQVTEIECIALGILGDLKALSIFYSPSSHGKGRKKNPLPLPAPSMGQIYSLLRCLYTYLESLSTIKIRESQTGEAPIKKRKLLEKRENEQNFGDSLSVISDLNSLSTSRVIPITPSASANIICSPEGGTSQKNYISHDLINILLGTIDSLSRSLAPASDEESLEVEVDLDVGPERSFDANLTPSDDQNTSSTSGSNSTSQVTPSGSESKNSPIPPNNS